MWMGLNKLQQICAVIMSMKCVKGNRHDYLFFADYNNIITELTGKQQTTNCNQFEMFFLDIILVHEEVKQQSGKVSRCDTQMEFFTDSCQPIYQIASGTKLG